MNSGERETAHTALVRAALMLLFLTALYGVLYVLFRSQFDTAGSWLSSKLGYAGVFLFVFIVDTFIVPATGDIVFLFTREWNPWLLVPVISIASIAGGLCGFLIGRSLTHLRWVQNATEYYRERGSRLILRYGAWAVALAAFTPLPYSTISWIAGMLGVSRRKYLLASLLRAPRFVLYYLALQGSIEALEKLL
jgi:membrane protein YqaA with SNARE-associated domain